MKIFLAGLLLSFSTCYSVEASAQKTKISINHIALYVHDLKKSTHFYREVVQLDTIPEPFHDGKHTWFSIGDKAQLHLIQGAEANQQHNKNTHLCFSTASMDSFINRLTKAGIVYENWLGQKGAVTKRPDGIRQIWFRDPDGYWVEINDDFR